MPRKSKTADQEIECGDFVQVVGGEWDGCFGIWEKCWWNPVGEWVHVVITDDEDEDAMYVPAVKLYKKAN
jgi:hypothetical protein